MVWYNWLLSGVLLLWIALGYEAPLNTDIRTPEYKRTMHERIRLQNETKENTGFSDIMIKAGIPVWFIPVLQEIGKKYAVNPLYLVAIWLSENIKGWGMTWCNLWPYQLSSCAWTWRKWKIYYGKEFTECAKDIYCASEFTADRLRNVYKCDILPDGSISNWEKCLANHQWSTPDGWYVKKIIKNWLLLWLN